MSENITWSSSIDGDLGTGTIINATLTEGVQTITATVMDSEGLTPEFATTLQVTVTQGGVQ
ncbi:MAG: hypothetical protein ACJARQ_000360 [Oleispira sp.]|uniref:Bacterial Ig-like domain-containing protein n=1 Tax=Oleispira antarctica RB-8 TaxID=698738 RepID=R4YSK7_OLEAN|nr:hypothetical protein OLEAN_C37390 [Oleispira antarctica RB-8]